MRKLILLIASVALIAGCRTSQQAVRPADPSASADGSYVEDELIAMADDQEEAWKIASLYGIELQEYSDGVAVYHTKESLDDVIRRGEANGWPQLQKNYIYQME